MLYQLSYSRSKGPRNNNPKKLRWWGMVDSNHRRQTPTGLQPVPFGRSGNPPEHLIPSPFGPRKLKLSESFGEELTVGLEPATGGLQNHCSAD